MPFSGRYSCLVLLFALTASYATAQTMTQLGLRSDNGQGQFVGLKADATGNLYTLQEAQDGLRLLKMDAGATQVLAQVHLGQQGDHGVALALDPAGNIYVAGTSLSGGAITGTPGTAFPTRSDSTTNSFVAKFTPALGEQWLTFLGSGRIAATALDASAATVVVTGGIFADTLPVTPAGIQQAPLPNSSGNGFVEGLDTATGNLQFSTYLSGANGGTQPSALSLDSSGNAYIVGSTTATGFPTVNALVPILLSDAANPASGFLTELTPAGDGFIFSTFIPGGGLTSVAVDTGSNSLLLSGDLARGFFPLTRVGSPIAERLAYQSVARLALDGSAVTMSALLAPSTTSSVAPAANGGFVFAAATQSAYGVPLLPGPAYQDEGNAIAVNGSSTGAVQRVARIGGIPVRNSAFSSLPVLTTGVLSTADGSTLVAAGIAPTLSSALISTQHFDLALTGAPTAALPSSVRDAFPSPSCSGSACAGGAGLLGRLPVSTAPQLALSMDNLPNLTLRNSGATEATNLQVSVTGYSSRTTCSSTLAAGSECDIALIGSGPGALRATAANAAPLSMPLPATTLIASVLSVSPKELDFGMVSSVSGSRTATFTVTNLSTISQSFISQQLGASASTPRSGSSGPFTLTEAGSDCTPAGDGVSKILAGGAACHITLSLNASSDPANDGSVNTAWIAGPREIAVTGYTHAAAITLSADHIGFGRVFTSGLSSPRALYVSNGSDTPQTHSPLALPYGSPFSLTDGCPGTLAPQSVCRIDLDYSSPHAPSADAVTLTLDGGLTVLVDGETLPAPSVTGQSVNPNLAVSPLAAVFPNAVVVSTISTDTIVVTIQNTGSSAFPLTTAVTGDFTASACPSPLAGGAVCAVTIHFEPSDSGTRQGLLAVTAGSASPVYVTLTGTGTGFLPIANGAIGFGAVPLHTPLVQWFKIPVPFNSFSAATSSPAFSIVLVEDQGYGHGTPDPASFAASANGTCLSCYIGVRFLPVTAGTQIGTLSLTTSGGGMSQSVSLTGTGRALTGVYVTPLSQDFGSAVVGASAAFQNAVLTNASTAPVTVSAPAFAGDFSASTSPTGGAACGGMLQPGESCVAAVQFTPSDTGLRTGTITFATDGGPVSASLFGFGAADPGLRLSPSSLRFENVPDASATQQTITLTNAGSGSAQIGTPVSSDLHFSAVTTCSTVSAGGTCTITVTYAPALSLSSGVLMIPVTTAPGGATQTLAYTVPLTGQYTAEDAGIQIVPGEEVTVNAGALPTGTVSTSHVLRVNNLSAKQLTVSIEASKQFPVLSSACGGLAPGGSCSLTVAYQPLIAGDATGTIFVQATPSDGSATLNGLAYLQGYGQATSTISVSGALSPTGVLDFGQVSSGQSSTRTLTVTNRGTITGGGSVTVRRVRTEAPYFATTTCGGTLPQNAGCTITLTYAPTYQIASSTGPAAPLTDLGTLTVEGDAENSPLFIDLSGSATAVSTTSPDNSTPLRALTTSQGSLNFAATQAGNASAAQTLTIANTGTVDLHIGGLLVSPGFSVSGACAVIPVGAACPISISYTPQSAGTTSGALEIQSDSASALEYVSLLGVGTPASAMLQPETLSFGSVLINTASSPQTATFTNNGSVPLTLGRIAASGDFSVGSMSGSTSCTSGSSLAAGASCSIAVGFNPAALGTRTGTLSVASSATQLPLTASLIGIGVQPQLTISPTALSFGNVFTGQSASLSLTLTNGSATAVNALGFSVTGDFTIASTCGPVTLSPSSSCSVTITFSPSALGARTGNLIVTSSDPASPLTVPLSGTGVQGGAFTFTVSGASTASASVVQGIPASFTVNVTPTGGFTGQVAITCTPQTAYQYVSCSANPAIVNMAGQSQTSSVTITTVTAISGSALLSSPRQNAAPLLALAASPLLLLISGRRVRLPLLVLLSAALLSVSGCGGGGGDQRLRYATTGSYQFTVTASSTTGIPVSRSVVVNVAVTAR